MSIVEPNVRCFNVQVDQILNVENERYIYIVIKIISVIKIFTHKI